MRMQVPHFSVDLKTFGFVFKRYYNPTRRVTEERKHPTHPIEIDRKTKGYCGGNMGGGRHHRFVLEDNTRRRGGES
ncbi:MAG: hypothetical protein ACFFB2_02350 [Promethearchaeota archaeon]